MHRRHIQLGFVELCAKILQIMRNDFKDYAHTFANYAHIMRTFIGFVLHTFGIQHRQCDIISGVYHKHVTSSAPSVVNNSC